MFITKKIESEVISLYNTGIGSFLISKKIGISKFSVLKILRKHRLVRNKDRCSKLNFNYDGKFYYTERICPKCQQKVLTKSKNKSICCRNHYRKVKGNNNCKKCSLKLQSGSGNPFYGKKHKKTSLVKMVKTLTKNPRKYKPSSKPEKIIYDILKSMNLNVIKTHRVDKYICDIFVKNFNLIIEFNGDYWHCNPNKYEINYFHPHKKKLAEQIWNEDKIRIDNLTNLGYNLEVIWESDFDSSNTLKTIIEKYVKQNQSFSIA